MNTTARWWRPEVVRQWREDAGLTTTELGQAINKTRVAISHVENGHHASLQIITEIATYLRRQLSDALTDEAKIKFAAAVKST